MISRVCLFTFALLTSCSLFAAPPEIEIPTFATVGDVDLQELAKGHIAMNSQTNLGQDRFMAVQSLYIVRAPVDVVLQRSAAWDPSRSRGTNVIAHYEFGSASPAAFEPIASMKAGSYRNLAKLTEGLPKPSSMLNLTQNEAESFKGNVPEFWMGVLASRAQAFASGGASAVPAYQGGSSTISPGKDLRQLLSAQGKVERQFSGLIGASGLRGGGKSSNYWELIDVEGLGAFVLGAFYQSKAQDTMQTLDVQYYASSGYYAALILHQFWPVTVDGKVATMVWRGDLISAPSLEGLRGVERVGSGRAMRREIEKTIDIFRRDAER